MKTFYADLPLACLHDLKTHTSLICRYADPVMILLMGSYAGDTFAPASVEGYDLVVLSREACTPQAREIKRYLYRHFPQQERHIKTVHIHSFPLSLFNSQVIHGNWFFYRLRKNGVILFQQPDVRLTDRKKIDFGQNIAWIAKARTILLPAAWEFCSDASRHLQCKSQRNAAISLFLALEQAFRCCYAVFFGILPAPMPLIDYQDSIAPFAAGLDELLDRAVAGNNTMLFRITRMKNLARYNLHFDAGETELSEYIEKTKAVLHLLENACKGHNSYLQRLDAAAGEESR